MRKFTVTRNQDGKHVVKAAQEVFSALESADLYRALKRKDIKIDGKRVTADVAVCEGQEVEIWLPEELFEKKGSEGNQKQSAGMNKSKNANNQSAKGAKGKQDTKKMYEIAYETRGLLIINKAQGIAVHSGKNADEANLIDLIRQETKFREAELCHRIDMNTGGLVMVAKNKKALEDAVALFRDKQVTKRYHALVYGVPDVGTGVVCDDDTVMYEVSAFLEKTKAGEVYIHDEQQPHDLPITTRYHVLRTYKGLGPDGSDFSLIECELVTGRTHQIRAHLAHLGYPVLGDGNYGRNKINTFFRNVDGGKLKHQQLYSTRITIGNVPQGNYHGDIAGKCFKIEPAFELDFGALGITR